MSRAPASDRRRRKGAARRAGSVRPARGVDPREQFASVLEKLVEGAIDARQAQRHAYAISSKSAIDAPGAVWRMLDSMAAEEQRGHRAVVFEGRIQLLTTAAGQLRAVTVISCSACAAARSGRSIVIL